MKFEREIPIGLDARRKKRQGGPKWPPPPPNGIRVKALCFMCLLTDMLKPHVRDKRLYGTLTSSLMLIPVTHPTRVAECAKCGFSGQANTNWGPSTELSGPSPDSIWP